MSKFIIEPHFRLQEWVAEEKGYFRAEGLDYEFRELIRSTDGPASQQGQSGRLPEHREGPRGRCQLRLPLDRERGGLQRPRQALCRRLFGRAVRDFRARGFDDAHAAPILPACRSRSASSRAATTRPSRRWSSTWRQARST